MADYEYISPNFLEFDGFRRVKKGQYWNFIDKDENILSPSVWFDLVYAFHNGVARVILNGKMNYIDIKGKLISSLWIDRGGDFHNEGYAFITLNNKSNAIDKNGKLLLPEWYDSVIPYKDKKYFQVATLVNDKRNWKLVEINKI